MVTEAARSSLVEYTNDGIPYGIRTLITEASGPYSVEPASLMESSVKGYIKELADGRFRVFAKAQHCGVKNRNGRIYPVPTWEQHLRETCDFMRRIGARGVIGHLEHPDDGKSKMPLAAILVTEARLDKNTGEIWIVFETMSTPPGRVVEAYVRDRARFGLSSRGNGSVVNEVWQELGERVDVVQEDYEPITWDVVIDESTPGAEVPASAGLREALDGLRSYLNRLDERAGGDEQIARRLLNEDTQKAVSAIDCEGGVCACRISESTEPLVIPPSGYSRYLLAFEDGSGHYRAYQGTTGQWEVWLHPHNLSPERLGTKVPTLTAAQQVAENHYSLVLAGGAVSAQQQAAHSNAIGMQANSPGMAGVPMAPQVVSPNIGGMAGMMGRYSGPAGPGPQTSRTPKVVLSFESLERARAPWREVLARLQEDWKHATTMPYSGTVVELDTTSSKKAKDVLAAVQRAGMFGAIKGEARVCVYTSYEDADQAAAHVQRILDGKGFKQTQAEAVARIRKGRIAENNMTGNTQGHTPSALHEYATNKSVSDGVKEPHGISPRYKGEDPEDLDLDLDVNERAPLGYDYTDEGDDMSGEYDMDDIYDDEPGGYETEADDAGDDDMDDQYGPTPNEMAYEADDEEDEYGDSDDAEECMMGYENVMGAAYESFGLAEKLGNRAQAKAFFGKMLGKTGKTITGKKAVAGQKRRLKVYAKKHGLKITGGIQQPDRSVNKAARKRKKNETHAVTFTRVVAESGEHFGAVRAWVKHNGAPVRYEFYNRSGMLESVVDALGQVIHSAAVNEAAAPHKLTEGEVWTNQTGESFSARSVINCGIEEAMLAEEELKARHGGNTGIATKGSEWQGKKGPEYSFPTMNKPGDRGQDGDAQTPGDYDSASEEGDGEYVKKGTMHGGGTSEAVGNLRDENVRLREQVAFLEGELARYEDIVQEQYDSLREADEAREREALARYRAEAISRHPELAVVESTLLRCESVLELEQQIGSCLSLVETVTPRYAPTQEPEHTSVLMERTERPRNGVSSHGVSAAPTGPLNESSTPFVGGPRRGENTLIGGGTVASRVAAHRRRRRN